MQVCHHMHIDAVSVDLATKDNCPIGRQSCLEKRTEVGHRREIGDVCFVHFKYYIHSKQCAFHQKLQRHIIIRLDTFKTENICPYVISDHRKVRSDLW